MFHLYLLLLLLLLLLPLLFLYRAHVHSYDDYDDDHDDGYGGCHDGGCHDGGRGGEKDDPQHVPLSLFYQLMPLPPYPLPIFVVREINTLQGAHPLSVPSIKSTFRCVNPRE